MITPIEMRVLDRNAQHFGVPILELMENAGKAVADVARSEFRVGGKNVLVLCGTGNNGGDGLGAARHLANEGHGPPRPVSRPVRDERSRDEFRTAARRADPRGAR